MGLQELEKVHGWPETEASLGLRDRNGDMVLALQVERTLPWPLAATGAPVWEV